MLEIRNLTKVYKSRRNESVVALNSISLKLPDTGLVFILGKSGSGKSTFLNVVGGLDRPDSGEIIINGTSSKSFKQKDFDSYRNTYLGFVFQEYYILKEFDINQNVALALKLQGKKATDSEIEEILSEVDLSGFGKRKSNELSGGQLQRVAIARALVKNPQIIFADEPTGALDSKTGESIFDTLKKLSKKKLIVVVSHDREFAELYGDRVIELKDGNVISDTCKEKVEAKKISDNLKIVDDKTMILDDGKKLSRQDLLNIKEFLNNDNEEKFIPIDGSLTSEIKHIARIDNENNHDVFTETDNELVEGKSSGFKSIKSKLKLGSSIKMGLSTLKTKKFRLIVTIFLSFLGISLFGIADSISSYSQKDAASQSILSSKNDSVSISKQQLEKYDDGTTDFSSRNVYEDDITKIKEKYNLDVKPVIKKSAQYGSIDLRITNNLIPTKYDIDKNGAISTDKYQGNDSTLLKEDFYIKNSPGFICSNEDEINNMNFTLHGTYPKNENEILLTKHLYDTFKYYGYVDASDAKKYILKDNMTEDSLIGKSIQIEGKNYNEYDEYKITGIIDTKFDTTDYFALNSDRNKNSLSDKESQKIYSLYNNYTNECFNSFADVFFTNQKTIDKLKDIPTSAYGQLKSNSTIVLNYNTIDKLSDKYAYCIKDDALLKQFETLLPFQKVLEDKNTYREELEKITISPSISLDSTTINNLYQLLENATREYFIHQFALDKYQQSSCSKNDSEMIEIMKYLYPQYSESSDQEIIDTMDHETNYSRENLFYNYITRLLSKNEYYWDDSIPSNSYLDDSGDLTSYFLQWANTNPTSNIFTPKKLLSKYIDKITSLYSDTTVTISPNYYTEDEKDLVLTNKEFNFVGLDFTYFLTKNYSYQQIFLANDNLYNSYKKLNNNINFFLAKKPSAQIVNNICKDMYDTSKENGTKSYAFISPSLTAIREINNMFSIIGKVFLYVGLAFAIFAALMMFNFITISINNKKKEIGILRALGARSVDVFKIFSVESFTISLISLIISIILTEIVIAIFNSGLSNLFQVSIMMFTAGIRQVLLMLLICFLVSFVSTLIPVFLIAKKKPVDAINDR